MIECPLISIIVPVYNVEKYLKKCIRSIQNQSFENFELILVDDGSPDKSGKICDEYAMRDERIQVIHQKNSGVSAARNKGIAAARGKYISFVDSDDWLHEDALTALHNQMEKCGADYCTGKVKIECLRDNIFQHNFGNCQISCSDDVKVYHIVEGIMGPWAALFRTKIIRDYKLGFDSNIKSSEDTIFLYQYFQRCKNVCSTEKVVYHYNRLIPNSAIHKYFPEFGAWRAICAREYMSLFPVSCNEDEMAELISSHVYNLFYAACYHYVKNCNQEDAIAFIDRNRNLFKNTILENEYFATSCAGKLSIEKTHMAKNEAIYSQSLQCGERQNVFLQRIKKVVEKIKLEIIYLY